ncbi:hypothetical protein [Paenibacillus eucommiae]|uniref:Uncharacterized protein n=1 Tax=Paenibacillus eucommiae TaxID=1355755 RepID=A0ABS4IY77_9BACL|nr:hypothetical protein [Paenibacillus eucommiae]MBP1992544.1 hypothetical protein [Paenibacillus eucommiae]
MTNEDLIIQCKIGLNISLSSTAFNGILSQKILTVKGFMQGAGVSAESFESELAVGVIVMGVGDLWNVKSGEIKFSPVFHTLLTQLAMR